MSGAARALWRADFTISDLSLSLSRSCFAGMGLDWSAPPGRAEFSPRLLPFTVWGKDDLGKLKRRHAVALGGGLFERYAMLMLLPWVQNKTFALSFKRWLTRARGEFQRWFAVCPWFIVAQRVLQRWTLSGCTIQSSAGGPHLRMGISTATQRRGGYKVRQCRRSLLLSCAFALLQEIASFAASDQEEPCILYFDVCAHRETRSSVRGRLYAPPQASSLAAIWLDMI